MWNNKRLIMMILRMLMMILMMLKMMIKMVLMETLVPHQVISILGGVFVEQSASAFGIFKFVQSLASAT